ncbi:type II secretion system F family protein [Caldalkalibacillus mannanilyticus]|uniref:type II secretion system F family protein n=1 Tax=Caldalkalibacillus mannanilyticus TaxID=1418 RepID=UPI000688EBC8|nr:type II secretion system F family protein [Caldalkalibacillus mannanilyticus]
MLILLSIAAPLVLLVLFLAVSAGQQNKEIVANYPKDFKLLGLAPASLRLLEILRMNENSLLYRRVHQKIILIYGLKDGIYCTKMYLAQIVSVLMVVLFGGLIVGILDGGNIEVLYFVLIVLPIIAYALIRELETKIKKRRESILLDLTEFVSKLVLLINAGETIQKAILRCIEQKEEMDVSPFYTELLELKNELQLNRSFAQSLEDFAKRCGVQEVSVFVTSVLLNYRRGGNELADSLRGLSHELWEKRKVLARTIGEQASSKLLFPMVLIFLIILVIIGYPAMQMMN